MSMRRILQGLINGLVGFIITVLLVGCFSLGLVSVDPTNDLVLYLALGSWLLVSLLGGLYATFRRS